MSAPVCNDCKRATCPRLRALTEGISNTGTFTWRDADKALIDCLRAQLATARAALAASEQKRGALAGALADVLAGEDGAWEGETDAPDHSHQVPGVWDFANGPPEGGTPCKWCATWVRARTALSSTPTPPEPAKPATLTREDEQAIRGDK